ncbi:MAG: RNA polymerase sigma factor [Planctomycetota bacterium]
MAESENILLRRFASTGDAEAFSEIVQRNAGLVYGACHRVLADKDRAADAVQETFLQLLRNAKTISGSVPNWLHRVATRKAIDLVRRDSSRRNREAIYAADKPQEVTKWQDLSRYVDEGLDDLDDQTREILIQRFFQGRTTSDIAVGQGVSQPTISRKIDAGVTQLRGKLRRRGVIVSVAAFAALLGENAAQAAPATVVQELGKIALVGSEAAAATTAGATAVSAAGAGTTAAGTGGNVATGVLAGVKAKVVTAAAVTAVGVGSVVTYNHVTEPTAPQEPAPVVARQQNSPRPSEGSVVYTQPAPVQRQAATNRQVDWSQYDGDMWEQIFAEEDSKAHQARLTPLPPPPDRGDDEPVGGMMMGGGFGGMGMGGMGGYAPEPGEEEDVNQPPMGYGGMGGVMYFAAVEVPPDDDDAAEEEEEQRD